MLREMAAVCAEALTAKSVDLSGKVIVIESLKKRKAGVHRQVHLLRGALLRAAGSLLLL